MIHVLTPWSRGPFELIVHAEIHFRNGEDHDRRLALISFDNAIEVAISTYLSLNPLHRNGNIYRRDDIDRWTTNFHTRIEFFIEEIQRRNLPVEVTAAEIIWYHAHRNEHYHSSSEGIPRRESLEGARKAALWVFQVLFDVQHPLEDLLDAEVARRQGPKPPPRSKEFDKLIDNEFGLVEIGETRMYTSEVLHSVDPNMYVELGSRLQNKRRDYSNLVSPVSNNILDTLKDRFGDWIRPEITSIRVEHQHDGFYLIVSTVDSKSVQSHSKHELYDIYNEDGAIVETLGSTADENANTLAHSYDADLLTDYKIFIPSVEDKIDEAIRNCQDELEGRSLLGERWEDY